ncbi:unnamed protein product [Lampetra fluviatilis]
MMMMMSSGDFATFERQSLSGCEDERLAVPLEVAEESNSGSADLWGGPTKPCGRAREFPLAATRELSTTEADAVTPSTSLSSQMPPEATAQRSEAGRE